MSNAKINDLAAVDAVTDATQFETDVGGTVAGKATGQQLFDYVKSKLPKNNLAATAAPVVGNDNTQGYGVGSMWFDTTHSHIYGCTSAATGAAVWVLLG